MVLRNAFEGLSVEAKQDAILAQLDITLSALRDAMLGGLETIALDSTTLAALETIQVGNFPANQTVSGTVAISNPTTNPETGLAKEVTLELIRSKLVDIYAAVDGLEVTAGNIEIAADTINLQTDEVEALLQAIRDRLPAALDVDGGAKVHVQNFPAVQPVSGTVTVVEPVSVDDNGASLTVDGTVGVSNMIPAVETGLAKDATLTTRLPAALDGDGGVKSHIQNFPATQPVSGTVALDGPTLAALETISAVVSGIVALDGPTLAALENIIVSGTVALDGPTLAALENINAVVTGTVALDGPTLAALETINAVVSGTVAVSNFPATQPVSGPLTDAQLRATPVPVSFPADEAGLTNAELRATPVPVSGTVSVNEPVTVDGTVALDPATLAALETINALVAGTVSVSNFPASVEVSNDAGNALPVSGIVQVNNLPTDYAKAIQLPGTVQDLPNTPTGILTTTAPVAFTADNTTDTLTSVGHGLANGDSVLLSSDNTLPVGLFGITPLTPIDPDPVPPSTVPVNNHREYFVRDVTANTFKLASTPTGAVVNFTTDGVGNHFWQKPSIFTGVFTDVEFFGGIIFLWANQPTSQRPARIQIEWSDDGVTPLAVSSSISVKEVVSGPITYNVYLSILSSYQAKYARVRAVSGVNSMTTPPIAIFYKTRFPFQGTFGYLDAALSFFSQALLTRTVIAGEKPDGVFANANLTAQQDLRVGFHAFEFEGLTLLDAPVLAAGEVVTPFVEVKDFAGILIDVEVDMPMQMTVDWSTTGVALDISHSYTTKVDVNGDFLIPVGSRFARIRIGNSALVAGVTTLHVYGQYQPQAMFSLPVETPIDPSFPASLVKSLTTGANPNGKYVNAPAAGTKILSPVPVVLGANGVYLSDWMDTEQYPTIKLLVATDVVSADNGILLQWSDSPNGAVIRSTHRKSFFQGHITDGLLIRSDTRARYLRVSYTNGATPQARFFLNLRFNPIPIASVVSLESTSAGETGQLTLGTNPAQVASSVLPGRRSIRLKNLSTSARALFYGFNAGVSASSGDELAVGEAVDLDIDQFVQVWAVVTSTAQGGVKIAWTQIA